MRPLQKLAFGVGHVFNDLCASIWFSYLIVFFHLVLKFDNGMAGHLLLLGQVVDALSTTIVGLESDRTSGCGKYGRRKSWHLLGTVCVAISFPFIFNNCFSCEHSTPWARFIYFAPFITIFQFGWATVQVSHLALLPSLSTSASVRVGLNSIRFVFTVLSNMAVFLIAFALLAQENGGEASSESLQPGDKVVFRNLSFIVVGAGIVFSTFFHAVVVESEELPPPSNFGATDGSIQQKSQPCQKCADLVASQPLRRGLSNLSSDLSDNESMPLLKPCGTRLMTWKDWFREPQFYQVALLYMSTRLIFNVSQVYQANYVAISLKLEKIHLALFPLTVYMASFLASFGMKKLNEVLGRKGAYLLGLLFCAAYSTGVHFLHTPAPTLWVVYCLAVLLGISLSCILVTSLSMVCDLIGQNTESSAFVYGCMSFMDKIFNGIAVEVIQHLAPACHVCNLCCQIYFRQVESYVLGGFILAALLMLVVLVPQRIGKRWKEPALDVDDAVDVICQECVDRAALGVTDDEIMPSSSPLGPGRRRSSMSQSISSSIYFDPTEAPACSRVMLPPTALSSSY